MAKTNKELAVELYSAFLISSGSLYSSANYKGAVKLPSVDDMAQQVKELTAKLSSVQDD